MKSTRAIQSAERTESSFLMEIQTFGMDLHTYRSGNVIDPHGTLEIRAFRIALIK